MFAVSYKFTAFLIKLLWFCIDDVDRELLILFEIFFKCLHIIHLYHTNLYILNFFLTVKDTLGAFTFSVILYL